MKRFVFIFLLISISNSSAIDKKFIPCEASVYGLLYPPTLYGFAEIRLLKYEFEFKHFTTGIGLIEFPYFPPNFIGILPLFYKGVAIGIPADFSVKLPSNFYFKMKSDLLLFANSGDVEEYYGGVVFFGSSFFTVFYAVDGYGGVIWFLRFTTGKRWVFPFKGKEIMVSPELALYLMGPYGCLLFGVEIGVYK